jgi:hypothetical protein
LVSWLSDNYESIHPKDNLDVDFGLNRTSFRHVFLNGEQLINGKMMMDGKGSHGAPDQISYVITSTQ